MAVRIEGVEPGSPAEKCGMRPGMQLVALDGHEIRDGLDYEFYSPPARLTAEVEDGDGRHTLVIEKDEYQPLGCVFGSYLIDKHHACRNKCVFCFIDQLPRGLRKSLYFKDDDERLSFLFGNYVTLTNLTDREIDRIIDMHIAPVNISVHTTNPVLRTEMMGNKQAGEVLRFIPRLAEAGVPMNTQLVLCPGLNDGPELERSIQWLASFAPAVQSIAAVPVGLTRHRKGLYPLTPYTKKTAAAQLDIMLAAGDRYKAEQGVRLVYPADEWFLLAGRSIPEGDFYDGYPQLENGVGMWRLLLDEFTQALAEMPPNDGVYYQTDLATGMAAAPLLRQLAAMLEQKFPGVHCEVHAIRNDFFGPGVTVAGLLTGADLMAQLQGRLGSGTLLLPIDTLRAEGDTMLDETTPEQLADTLDVAVEVVPNDGAALLDAMLGVGEAEEEEQDGNTWE